jgi:uncharacterized protein (TIGR03435 family)
VDRTGLEGCFDFDLQFAPDETTPRFFKPGLTDGPSSRPFLFEAMQEQLGLRLERSRGPGKFLVIEHIGRPSEN